jgi:hypothetical protein
VGISLLNEPPPLPGMLIKTILGTALILERGFPPDILREDGFKFGGSILEGGRSGIPILIPPPIIGHTAQRNGQLLAATPANSHLGIGALFLDHFRTHLVGVVGCLFVAVTLVGEEPSVVDVD